ncbi:hypothetical protein EGW08_006438 [Elysia chlorotica]|uniref:Uncharacterized protein n=1 Tax=Elysia chlorotica TaxID=188477 RepID=A0A3S1BKC7_ELYCH|nr:hypothetical protein EGW08_006438 [Elysia chlorotica]
MKKEKEQKKFATIEEEVTVEEEDGSVEKKISSTSSEFSIGEGRKPITTIQEIEEVEEDTPVVPPQSYLTRYPDYHVRFSEPDEDLEEDSSSDPKEDNMPNLPKLSKSEQGSQDSFENAPNGGDTQTSTSTLTTPPSSDSTVSLSVVRPDADGVDTAGQRLKKPGPRSASPSKLRKIAVSPAPKRSNIAVPNERIRKVSPLANPDGDGVPDHVQASAKYVSSRAQPAGELV